ncbi:unnamed protein product [Nippostrongylus brasiliensis]|uniref:Uncharacterized protein n=1 Tax=Nippostrongylus brasiliensis TaxID=27835 RepID=A0A0N4Y685_NIPBR|nr:unnamed protein product [Nippostrongylus brasiliensis]
MPSKLLVCGEHKREDVSFGLPVFGVSVDGVEVKDVDLIVNCPVPPPVYVYEGYVQFTPPRICLGHISPFYLQYVDGGGGGGGGGGQVVAVGTVGGGGGGGGGGVRGGGGEEERYIIIEDDGYCRPQCKRLYNVEDQSTFYGM